MFAVLKTGGKQYKVAEGDVLRVEKLAAAAGETVQFNEILMIGSSVGTPLVDGAGVQAEVIDQIRGEKTINFVKRRRKHSSKRTKGHRQSLTLVRVTDLLESGADASGVKAAIGAGAVSGSAMAAATGAASAAAGGTPAAKSGGASEAQAKPSRDKTAKTAAEPAASVEATPAPAADKAPDSAEVGSRPGNLLEAPRAEGPDDLKKISGVGPKLESLLHANGVFHFDQIAAWGPDEIAYMDDKLSFKGRIERDAWISQAEQFEADKE